MRTLELVLLMSLFSVNVPAAELAGGEDARVTRESRFSILPVNTCRTSKYGPRSLDGREDFHSGTDFRAAVGTPVVAVGDGVVTGIGSTDLCGKYVEIKFENPSVYGHYCHLSSVTGSLEVGSSVRAGQTVGKSGKTGTRSPHLHFVLKPRPGLSGLKRPGKSFNPEQYLPALRPCG